jgi:uncharacterized RDD family membrane protein YckC
MANTNGQIDTRIQLVTPENIAFQYRVAGPFRRLPAFLFDLGIRVGIAIVGSIAAVLVFGAAGMQGVGVGLQMLLWFVLSWFYGGLFEALWNGQTPGKRLLGIRVVSVEGQPITPFQAILRNILRDVDAQPGLLYQIGLVSATLNDRFQRLGDLAAGTMVVIEEGRRLQGVVPIYDAEAIRLASLIPPSFQPSRSLAKALAAYAQRRPLFPQGRRLEIARHVGEPLRDKFGLPVDTNLDMLLCALYRRAFIVEHDTPVEATPQGSSPFMATVVEPAVAPTVAPTEFAQAIVVDEAAAGDAEPAETTGERGLTQMQAIIEG